MLFLMEIHSPSRKTCPKIGLVKTTSETVMYKSFLVPTDGSNLSLAAVKGAASFAKTLEAKITLLTVIEPYNYAAVNEYRPESIDDYDERMLALAQDRLTEARGIVEEYDVPVETVATKNFSPAEAIISTAEQKGCDCIFMASHGRKGLAALILGSETQRVLAYSKKPVIVYR